MRKILFAVALGLMTIAAPAGAADLRGSQNVSVGRSESVQGNLYVGGKTVAVEGETAGDALLGGWHVSLTGPVRDDAAIAGMSVSVTSPVGGDVRVAGRDVSIGGPVGGEAVVMGSSVLVLEAASIAGDLVVYGEDITVSGHVGGNLKLHGSKVVFNGSVAGDAVIEGMDSVTFGSGASVGGKLSYRSPKEIMMPSGITSQQYDGAVVVADGNGPRQDRKRGGFGDWLVKLAMAIAAGLVFFLISRRRQESLAKQVGERPWTMAGLGFLVLVTLPVAVVLLVMTILGIPVAMLVLMAFAVLTLVAWVLCGTIAALLISRHVPRLATRPFDWMTVVGGTFALHVVGAVPLLGGLVSMLVFLAAQGVLCLALWRAFQSWHGGRR